jgi:predicted DNA-binding transcriptional regulator AlpA
MNLEDLQINYEIDSEPCDRLMDQNEVAEILSVSPKTLEYWRWKRTGPEYVKMGRFARYRESAIRKYIEDLDR